MDPEEMKKLQEATSKTLNENIASVKLEIQKSTDEKIEAVKKENVELKTKVTEMEKTIHESKGFNVVGKYPAKFQFAGKSYNLDNQGEDINKKISDSSDKGLFKIFGKDNAEYYNFKKWAICTYLAAAFKGNSSLQKAYEEFIGARNKASEMVEGTDSLGGYGVPIQYESEFILLARNASFALNECSLMNVSTNVIKFPKELTGTTVYYPGEATAPTESNFTQDELSITVVKAMILTELISSELISDSIFDIVGYLTNEMSYAMGQNMDDQVLNRSGVGLLTSAITNAVTLSGTGFNSMTDINFSDALTTLSDEAESKAKWVMNKKLVHYVRTIKDSTGRSIFQPGAVPGAISTLWEAPIIKSSKATLTDGAATSFAVCGDLKQMLIVRNPGVMTVESDPYHGFDKDMIRFRIKDRHGFGIKRAGDFCRVATKA